MSAAPFYQIAPRASIGANYAQHGNGKNPRSWPFAWQIGMVG
jgi:hypothetical protein